MPYGSCLIIEVLARNRFIHHPSFRTQLIQLCTSNTAQLQGEVWLAVRCMRHSPIVVDEWFHFHHIQCRHIQTGFSCDDCILQADPRKNEALILRFPVSQLISAVGRTLRRKQWTYYVHNITVARQECQEWRESCLLDDRAWGCTEGSGHSVDKGRKATTHHCSRPDQATGTIRSLLLRAAPLLRRLQCSFRFKHGLFPSRSFLLWS